MMKIAGILFLAWFSAMAATPVPFSSQERLVYLGDGLDSLNKMSSKDRDNLKEAVAATERQKCRSFYPPATLGCLQKEAREQCASAPFNKEPHCTIAWDMAIVNRINEKQFISSDEKFQISEKASDFSSAYSKELRAKYALLATQLILVSKKHCSETDSQCLVKEIDRYCLRYASTQDLAWQACASAIIWFVAGSQSN